MQDAICQKLIGEFLTKPGVIFN